ncbi:MAG: EF-hand domain-containing protein [Pseudomonadota bacterium]|nr:EF-hand domain-containing protein [Pseudomonadota bacterium]
MKATRRHISRFLFATVAILPFATFVHAAPSSDDDDTGLPNTFISPCGKPFRAAAGAPYPVVDWFKAADKGGDGKLDRDEFVADAAAFFKVLDLNGDGVLNHYEVAVYERRIAPEILGAGLPVGAMGRGGARLWLAQIDQPSPIDPGGEQPQAAPRTSGDLDESGQGAAPYSLLAEPEPIMAADLDLNGFIRKANFLKLADMHFTTLDPDGVGYLTLARLPKTPIQRLIEKTRPKRRKS